MLAGAIAACIACCPSGRPRVIAVLCTLSPYCLIYPRVDKNFELLRSLIFFCAVYMQEVEMIPRVCPVTSSPPLLFSRVCINFCWYLIFPRSLKIDLDCTSRRMGYTKIS